MEQRWNGRVGEMRDPRENPPTSGIVRGIDICSQDQSIARIKTFVWRGYGDIVCVWYQKLRKLNTISAYTRQKANSKYRNLIRLERASQKQSIDTHKTAYDRPTFEECRQRKDSRQLSALRVEAMRQLESEQESALQHTRCEATKTQNSCRQTRQEVLDVPGAVSRQEVLDVPGAVSSECDVVFQGKKYSMFLVLPNDKDGLDKALSKVTPSLIRMNMKTMTAEQVEVKLPKFKFEYTAHLRDILKKMGIQRVFQDNAELNEMIWGGDNLKVSSIVQKAGLEVNEQGTVAYETTVVNIPNKWGGTNEFHATHPFMFFIEDETTGTVIFVGKVMVPSPSATEVAVLARGGNDMEAAGNGISAIAEMPAEVQRNSVRASILPDSWIRSRHLRLLDVLPFVDESIKKFSNCVRGPRPMSDSLDVSEVRTHSRQSVVWILNSFRTALGAAAVSTLALSCCSTNWSRIPSAMGIT
ncbi:hypothetical protein PR048_014494 [Dryococelus australis]|uniref:Serpin domain-containing protein n=1 Tax=Dryococelus australis TaxID=614101 RepID=A0ABQ9HEL7_9NEOP|nr:hypothetical protein PR048_014494 [Dryococelus australis]